MLYSHRGIGEGLLQSGGFARELLWPRLAYASTVIGSSTELTLSNVDGHRFTFGGTFPGIGPTQ